ncbi:MULTISPECIES: Ppx/GppA phosphatase family protein [unclassified Paenibacillus]|uniref:Ppx/GppA phosphatase family protein n=1 Tax=unclassified Paenibacillus TaxID=185978 RepID=UPI001AE5A951|nr:MULTISPECIES: Ppx/GppA phosphatase family protein [unclassified Paenibacillus]MBP1154608.1 exopolyphosphatase/guanosine-5'-triphosphate,3'-diphosphate pyrophosphatase [Paenibacillus sp. PvP091]MBP1170008.1 exopolyphosphatase/guanosine-5'-triphosphate,3'-diphosphate pyrophosphatase [Paenibacillus sp. PvR098]MBP2441036.1 exopolyphosphatase/guanosine-5'-triphosphate,3'-diphosphate pyrophosphatase [Paenibacillus sp. PvP052]
MNNSRRIGIIDIGSNSIRLAIYELHDSGAYQVIGEFKESARLSQRIGPDGALPPAEIQNIVRMLTHFKRICHAHGVTHYRAAATAAIRNASNAQQIAEALSKHSGFHVEILSGKDEARLGFLGMMQTMDITDGFLVDIGGGSTEISLFRDRKLLQSVSFPFGAVNTTRRFAPGGEFQSDQLNAIRQMVLQALSEQPWISKSPGLPLVGLGGGVRTLSKIDQRKRKYSLPITHNYVLSSADMDELAIWLPSLPAERRKKVDGLSKDRYDIIVPGLIILQTIFQTTGAMHYVVSGAGLRDGLFFESFCPPDSGHVHIAERSADHFLSLHSTAPAAHIARVKETALKLFDVLAQAQAHHYDSRQRLCLSIAARLYRIGASLQYYQFPKHTFHMIAHTRIDGLSHRELLSCALIATYKAKNRTQHAVLQYKDIISDSDVEQIWKLGTLVRLAIALDASETNALELESATVEGSSMNLHLKRKHDPSAEYREVEGLQKEFKKIWGLQLTFQEKSFSTT